MAFCVQGFPKQALPKKLGRHGLGVSSWSLKNALKVFVATAATLRVAYDESGRHGVCGRRVKDCTRRRHCWFGYSWTISRDRSESRTLRPASGGIIFLEVVTRSWFEGGTLRSLWNSKQVSFEIFRSILPPFLTVQSLRAQNSEGLKRADILNFGEISLRKGTCMRANCHLHGAFSFCLLSTLI